MYIPELDYHCDLCAETLVESDITFDWSTFMFADSDKELRKRLEKHEYFPAELFDEHFSLPVNGAIVSDGDCCVFVRFATPLSVDMDVTEVLFKAKLTEGERKYIERLICEDLGINEDE